eukprot:3409650-Rhodomonas_salina.4
MSGAETGCVPPRTRTANRVERTEVGACGAEKANGCVVGGTELASWVVSGTEMMANGWPVCAVLRK